MTPAYFETTESLTFSPGQLVVVSGNDLVAIYTLLFNAKAAMVAASIPTLDPIDTRTTINYPDGVVSGDIAPTASMFKTGHLSDPCLPYLTGLTTLTNLTGMTLMMKSGVNIGQSRTIQTFDLKTNVVTLATALPTAPAAGDVFNIIPADEHSYKYEFLAVQNRVGGPTPKVVLIGNQFDREDPEQNPWQLAMDTDQVVMDLLFARNVFDVPDVRTRQYAEVARELFQYISKVYYYDSIAGEVTFIKDQIPER